MKFFEKHFTKHHLFHAPHKWFLAFLSSPIHFLEMHYKKKYHLNFKHARKLFLFDMSLLASIILLVGASLFWWKYDPTITKFVELTITPSSHTQDGALPRINSGEHITFSITYTNSSDTPLVDPILNLTLPEGFVVNSDDDIDRTDENFSYTLDAIAPSGSGSVSVDGELYGNVPDDVRVLASLSYRQESREAREEIKTILLVSLLRSHLETSLEIQDSILERGSLPVTITMRNPYHHSTPPISVPFTLSDEFTLRDVESDKGTSNENQWRLPEGLAEGEEIVLEGTIAAKVSSDINEATVPITPLLSVNGTQYKQSTESKKVTVLHPRLSVSSAWRDTGNDVIAPGKSHQLDVTVRNTGDIAIGTLRIHIPIDTSVISQSGIRSRNGGRVSGGEYIYTPKTVSLDLGESTSFSIEVPVLSFPTGGGPTLKLSPYVTAAIPEIPGTTYRSPASNTGDLRVGGNVSLSTELRYYTNEGDQLGRGPLPPQVGKETKYWALLKVQNGSSDLKDVIVTAKVPAGVVWTGRSSVSHGRDVTYNSSSRTMSWSLGTLPAFTQAGINFELSLTPSSAQLGTSPLMLNTVSLSATDSYIDEPIKRSAGAVSISIPTDGIGKLRGTAVR